MDTKSGGKMEDTSEECVAELLSLRRVSLGLGLYVYQNERGEFHRIHGPAVVDNRGAEFWYFCGQLHRENGPAYETPGGHKEWYRHGIRHRDDGPAVEYIDGSQEWYMNGKRID